MQLHGQPYVNRTQGSNDSMFSGRGEDGSDFYGFFDGLGGGLLVVSLIV